MGCDPAALKRYSKNILRNPQNADYWLEQWHDSTTRATEWDADQWGFNPDTWMAQERAIMRKRIAECKHGHGFHGPCRHGR